MFGVTPGYGLFARHVRNLEVHHADLRTAAPDGRPPVALFDVDGARFDHVRFAHASAAPTFLLQSVRRFALQDADGLRDVALTSFTRATL